jgi:hypothetical protein
MDQGHTALLDQHKEGIVKSRGGVRQGCCLSPNVRVFKSNSIVQTKLLKSSETSNTDRIQVICTVEHADDLAILGKEEMVLQGVSVRMKLEDSMEWK